MPLDGGIGIAAAVAIGSNFIERSKFPARHDAIHDKELDKSLRAAESFEKIPKEDVDFFEADEYISLHSKSLKSLSIYRSTQEEYKARDWSKEPISKFHIRRRVREAKRHVQSSVSQERTHVDELETYSRSVSSRSSSVVSFASNASISSGLDLDRSRPYRTDSVSVRAVGHSPPSASLEDVGRDETRDVAHDHVSEWLSMFARAHIEDISNAPPLPPDSPVNFSPVDEPSSSSSSLDQQSTRQHTLHELLSSERAYASDLALTQEILIPLALGQQPQSFSPSHSSSPRALSFSSEASFGSARAPMMPDDVRIIFSNIEELARFSDDFCELLEDAIGSSTEGGVGKDHVGALFLKMIPNMECPYKHYITCHPAALAHLQSLPQTPALTAYLAQIQSAASSLSHAWDLSSLLIRPVHRLFKYRLFLAAIIEVTPDGHTDKENLRCAQLKVEEIARSVNEGRRHAKVVKEVPSAKKKSMMNVPMNVTRMKSLEHASAVRKPGGALTNVQDANDEAKQVEKMHVELKQAEHLAQQFAKDIVEWAKSMLDVVRALRVWAISFGKVIWLSPNQASEAFNAFVDVVEVQLMPLCYKLEEEVGGRLMKELAHLLATTNQPQKLLALMNEHEPFHSHLLNMATNRSAPALLTASTNYLALRSQLAAELPSYLVLLHRGLGIFLRKFARVQAEFWRDVRDKWADLWDMLRVEGEMNAGCQETLSVWRTRWDDADKIVSTLNINQAKSFYLEPEVEAGTYAYTHSISVENMTPPTKKAPQNTCSWVG